jgi:hypothetical protein
MEVECKFIIVVSRVLLGYHSNTCWIDSLLFRIQAACVVVLVLVAVANAQFPSREVRFAVGPY